MAQELHKVRKKHADVVRSGNVKPLVGLLALTYLDGYHESKIVINNVGLRDETLFYDVFKLAESDQGVINIGNMSYNCDTSTAYRIGLTSHFFPNNFEAIRNISGQSMAEFSQAWLQNGSRLEDLAAAANANGLGAKSPLMLGVRYIDLRYAKS